MSLFEESWEGEEELARGGSVEGWGGSAWGAEEAAGEGVLEVEVELTTGGVVTTVGVGVTCAGKVVAEGVEGVAGGVTGGTGGTGVTGAATGVAIGVVATIGWVAAGAVVGVAAGVVVGVTGYEG